MIRTRSFTWNDKQYDVCVKCMQPVVPGDKTCVRCERNRLRIQLNVMTHERDRLVRIADVFHRERVDGTHATSAGDKAAGELILLNNGRPRKGQDVPKK